MCRIYVRCFPKRKFIKNYAQIYVLNEGRFLSKCFLCETRISNSVLQSSQCVREVVEKGKLCYDDKFVKK